MEDKQLKFVSLGSSLVNIAVLLVLSNSNEISWFLFCVYPQFPMPIGVNLLLLLNVFEMLD